jgi:glycosyltransferase involved in cell wall biosynthesis
MPDALCLPILMRRVLFIAYLYPPIANSGTRRSLCFSNHLADSGWEPVVLTLDAIQERAVDKDSLHEIRAGMRVERVALGSRILAQRLSCWLPRPWRGRLEDALSWRLSARNQVPDEVACWLKPAVARGIALHREKPFDAIYASGWPWTSFLIAQNISEATGLPYVLDYRDNWNPLGAQGANAWDSQNSAQAAHSPGLERAAAASAAAVVTVTETLAHAMAETAGRSDFHIITNGFEPADFASPTPAPEDGLLRVTYTGVWRPGYGLHELYQAIALLKQANAPVLKRLRVEVAGFPPGPALEHGVADVVLERGPVGHDEALRLMQQADVQFLPVPTGFYAEACLPGKVFEYMGSGRPILALAPPNSEVAKVLAEVGGAICLAPGDVAGIAAVLERLSAGESVFDEVRPERLQRYTRAATTAQLVEVLQAAVGAPKKGQRS